MANSNKAIVAQIVEPNFFDMSVAEIGQRINRGLMTRKEAMDGFMALNNTERLIYCRKNKIAFDGRAVFGIVYFTRELSKYLFKN